MSAYNGLERYMARALGHFPVIKSFSKFCYSRLVYLKKRKPCKASFRVKPIAFRVDQRESFFGYYDKSPENSKGLVLAQLSSRSTKNVPSITSREVELGVFNQGQELLLSVLVNAYNWQQGCRAHWLDEDQFIFNDFDSEREAYVSRVYSVAEKKQVRFFSYPIQDSFEKQYFISLNYQRLMTLRPDYGYRNLPNLSQADLSNLQDDGLLRVDYETGEAKTLITIEDACKVKPVVEFDRAVHKFNHVMISPSGRQFIFMHRYLIGRRRFDRLLLADSKTGEIKLLNDFGMVSHCFWIDELRVLGFMRGPKGKDGYWIIDVESGQFNALKCEKLDGYGDGHPHVVGDWFVTDTYPDKACMQHLLLCNWRTGEVQEIGEFFHGFDYSGETRCDLHPRLSPDGKRVYFDSVFDGGRRLYSMDLK